VSNRSFENVNYSLRPAKCVERKMIVEAISRVGLLEKLSGYKYVGLGSVDFVDFRLVHYRLGLTDMVSIEAAKSKSERFRFNRPLACIDLHFGESSDVLPELDWKRPSIVWMDYDSKLDISILNDISLLMNSVPSGSVVIVSVNCEPLTTISDHPSDVDIHQLRYAELLEKVGENRLPAGLKPANLRKWGLANASWKVLDSEVRRAIANRNAALSPLERVNYDQLFHFRYADGAKMLTVGGLVLTDKDRESISTPEHFDDLGYIRDGDEAYEIVIPVLTLREMRQLDTKLPSDDLKHLIPFLTEKQIRNYARIYRYFPTYLEVESY
jgi:Putative O-methyltransferase